MCFICEGSILDCPKTLICKDLKNTFLNSFSNLKYINCSESQITHIEVPNNLVYLDCSKTNIMSLRLPKTLKVLLCQDTKILSLPELPKLQKLDCSHTFINRLPKLPNSLGYLNCSHTKITELPNIPKRLKYLNITVTKVDIKKINVNLRKLFVSFDKEPELKLPESLKLLDCRYSERVIVPYLNLHTFICTSSNINEIPILPENLVHFDCSYTKIKALPPLPNSIFYLNCCHTRIKELPNIPYNLNTLIAEHTDLEFIQNLKFLNILKLNLSSTKLVSLPELPEGLKILHIANCFIKTLPELPNSILYLTLQYSNTETLPVLPSLTFLNISYTKIKKLPTLPNTLTSLYCCGVSLKRLPSLPRNIEVLDISESEVIFLPKLHHLRNLRSLRLCNSKIIGIPLLPPDTKVICRYCPNLLYISKGVFADHCPRLLTEKQFESIIKLQAFIRRNFKYFVFKHWIKSKEGVEWIYHPNHTGGRFDKNNIKKFFS